MRIHVNKIFNDQPVFGAVMFTIKRFEGFTLKYNKKVAMFETENHGIVYCDAQMLTRIVERLKANNLDYKIAENTLSNLK